MAGPRLLVDVPPHRLVERRYALSVLLGEWLACDYDIRVVDALQATRVSLAGTAGGGDAPAIVLPDALLSPATPWLTKASLPSAARADPAPEWTGIDGSIPLLYPIGDADRSLIRRDGAEIVLQFDLVGSLFFMLTRYEEQVGRDVQDRHGRFPAEASVAARHGWLQLPILDMYLHVFAALVRLAWPGVALDVPAGEGPRIGHDVDHPASRALWHGSHRLRVVAADAVRRRDPGLALRRARSFLGPRETLPSVDPFNTFDFLMSTSEAFGLKSAFFFMTRDTGPPDGSVYAIEDAWARTLIREIAARGHEIGLHGSYASYLDGARIGAEWSALIDASRDAPQGAVQPMIRQHFLRWRAGATWRAQQEAGLRTDETLGYADAIGFRAGTARSFTAYDIEAGQPLSIRVRPLHVMDATLSQYLDIGLEDGLRLIAELTSTTRRFGGGLSVLWHNSALETAEAKRQYGDLLRILCA